MTWEPWESSAYCEPQFSTEDGTTYFRPFVVYAASEGEAKMTVLITLGWMLKQMGVQVEWLK